MSKTPTQGERADFRAFCEQATDNQICEIERKEREAKRTVFAQIAESEIHSRGLEPYKW